MTTTIKARISHGVIEPLEEMDFPEGKEVFITITEIPANNEVADLNKADIWENDPLFTLAGIFDSGLGDLAEEHDKYLYCQKDK
ncbi:antitoxin family protein [Candidatus Magnetomonas plexicatena]|uniref:antitoxin family protein n=1 Tax=Candidatus Magnetomonas plexicatena TaxID=2552947 RepID=UPI0011000F98|nr:antitoxin family protein [Nitrospirales bacterium LBB_01]